MHAEPSAVAQFFQSADTKFYMALVGLLWTTFKGFNWVKDIREKDLKGLKDDIGTQTHVIGTGFNALAAGISELRNDFRTFYTSPDPLMIPVSARTTRKRKSVAARAAAAAAKPPKTKARKTKTD
jgi:hypothetical protein